jgi:hypothetical protein
MFVSEIFLWNLVKDVKILICSIKEQIRMLVPKFTHSLPSLYLLAIFNQLKNVFLMAVFRIRDILVRIRMRIRILGPVLYGTFDYQIRIRILLFSSVTFKTPTRFYSYSFFKLHLHHSSKIKKATKQSQNCPFFQNFRNSRFLSLKNR